jgi:hypothetical protein
MELLTKLCASHRFSAGDITLRMLQTKAQGKLLEESHAPHQVLERWVSHSPRENPKPRGGEIVSRSDL